MQIYLSPFLSIFFNFTSVSEPSSCTAIPHKILKETVVVVVVVVLFRFLSLSLLLVLLWKH